MKDTDFDNLSIEELIVHKVKVGDLVKHAFRKNAIYQIMSKEDDNTFTMQRAAKSKNWALQGNVFTKIKPEQVTFYARPDESYVPPVQPPVVKVTLEQVYQSVFIARWIKDGFCDLASSLSLESLSCGGDASQTAVKAKVRMIERNWSLLEQIADYKVHKPIYNLNKEI